MPESKIEQLISRLIDGTISKEDQDLLSLAMKEDSNVRDLYAEMMQMDSILRWESRITVGNSSISLNDLNSGKLKHQLMITRLFLTSAIVLCAFLLGYQWMTGLSHEVQANSLVEGEPVAVLSRINNVQWKTGRTYPNTGGTIYPGWLDLLKGQATVGMLNGTNLLLDGEVRLGLNAYHRASLQKGKLSVYTPESESTFTLSLPWGNIETKGGLFVVIHSENKNSEIKVQSGSVHITLNKNLFSSQKTDLVIKGNDGVKIDLIEKRIQQYKLEKSDSVENYSLGNIDKSKNRQKVIISESTLKPFGFQDGQYSLPTQSSILDKGTHLKLKGNAWKCLEINTAIYPGSVIEFDFKSQQEGQIHGIGFSNIEDYSKENPIFQVYGYEHLENIYQQFDHYDGTGWQHFQIPIGLYLKGDYQYLVFIADEDVMGTAESQFRNIRITSGK